jgi:hypothetical protein
MNTSPVITPAVRGLIMGGAGLLIVGLFKVISGRDPVNGAVAVGCGALLTGLALLLAKRG